MAVSRADSHLVRDLNTDYSKTANSGVLGDLEITEVGFARRGFVRPKHQHRAPVFGGVRTMLLAGFDVNRRAGKVFFSFINNHLPSRKVLRPSHHACAPG